MKHDQNEVDWPDKDYWSSLDSDEFEEAWQEYLADPEADVETKLKVFTEPSTQGGTGSMFIFDESGEDGETISVNFQDWTDEEFLMASNSDSAEEYKQKYYDYIYDLIVEYWGRF